MKLIHLSDLHLGKRVNEFSMLEDQAYILRQILNIVDDQRPDAVLIAGDVYDKAVPPAEAVSLFDGFLTALAERETAVFLISGNHDSAERLAFGARLLCSRGVYVSPVYRGAEKPVELRDSYGSVYIQGIHYLYEFSCGPLSGWMYRVDGEFPNFGCSKYRLKDGQVIEWVYTCDLGKDVGCEWKVEGAAK